MPDEQESASGGIPGLITDLIGQLRGVTEGLEGLVGIGPHAPSAPGGRSVPGLLNLPRPGALSAAELNSIASSVAAQRRSIEALQAQLSAFDQQLAVLERILGPLAEWSRTWAELEERLLSLGRGSGTEDHPRGS